MRGCVSHQSGPARPRHALWRPPQGAQLELCRVVLAAPSAPGAAGVAGRPCTAEGCTKYPRDDKQSRSSGIYCGEHKLPGVVGAVSERCGHETRERCPASSDTWAAGRAGALRRGARRRARRRAARTRWRCGYTWTAPRAAARRIGYGTEGFRAAPRASDTLTMCLYLDLRWRSAARR